MREVFHCNGTAAHFRERDELVKHGVERPGTDAKEAVTETIDDIPIWLDYISLRQCVNDFSLSRLRQLLSQENRDIAIFVAAAQDGSYMERTFCVFELFACQFAKKKMVVAQNFAVTEAEMHAVCKDVKTEAAQTRDPVQKDTIDNYIKQCIEGAHEGLDRVVKEAFMQSVEGLRGAPPLLRD